MRPDKQKDHHHEESFQSRKNVSRQHGAKTFRRGRALAFLERMERKRSTLKKQLEAPELQGINLILIGELKAVEMVISEFVQLFELHETDEIEKWDAEEKIPKKRR